MAKRQVLDSNGDVVKTILGKDTVLEGDMVFDQSLKIDGRFKGRIHANSSLYIEEGATVEAEIKVKSIIIGGQVKGEITAVDRLEMLSSARIHGNIKTSRLRIADGVLFEGKCEMIKDHDLVDIFVSDVAKLKQTLSEE